jgi:hypothetical protein
MTIIDDEWEYNSVNLTTLAYKVKALGAPEQIPEKRGENIVVPHKTGRVYVQKFYNERELDLSMFVQSTSVSSMTRSATNLLANLDALKKAFGAPGYHILKRKFKTGEVRWTYAEVVDKLEFEGEGPDHYIFVARLRIWDPWWYAESGVTIGPTTITTSPQSISVTNSGTYQVERAIIKITGAITNPRLNIASGVYCEWIGTVPSGSILWIDCASHYAPLDGADKTGLIAHVGSVWWLPIATGVNTLTVTGTSISGATVTIYFYVPYI